jgi:hypothetical protein
VSIESLKQADFHEQLREFGFEIIDEGPEGLRACMASEIPRYKDIIARRASSGCSPVAGKVSPA